MYKQVSDWADQYRKIKVRTNADTPKDAQVARASAPKASACAAPSTCSSRASASGPSASSSWPTDKASREKALAKLLPYQRSDFEGIFEAMNGLPGHHPPAGPAPA
jgi:pyruvate,orthophosphate dikinase